MKDSKGNEIGLKRLDMLTDDDLEKLKGDVFDDWNWKTGSPFARMVYDFCVIEEDHRIRGKDAAERKLKQTEEKLEVVRQMADLQDKTDQMMRDSMKNFIKDEASGIINLIKNKRVWKQS
jgi:hypothetical protein